MMAVTMVLAFGMVWLSTRSKFVPYVVEVDKLGYALGASNAIAGCGGNGFGMNAR
jgi:type IV secretory pathway TrbF-like protein